MRSRNADYRSVSGKFEYFFVSLQQKFETMGKVKMLGALVGDIVGSVYEFCNTKSTEFELFCGGSSFTDDSVMTLAVAKWLLEDEAHTIHYLIQVSQVPNLPVLIDRFQ